MEKRTSYRISISKMTNITTNLGSNFFGFFRGDLKIIVARFRKKS